MKEGQGLKIKEFNQQIYIVNHRGELIEVPPEGSLGILALGSIGYKAWKRAEAIADLKKNNG